MGAIRKSTELVDKGLVPTTLDQLHEAMLALRSKWISATFLPALLGLGDCRVTAQKASEMVSLEFSGLSGILRDSDSGFHAIPARGGLDHVLYLGRAPAAADDIE